MSMYFESTESFNYLFSQPIGTAGTGGEEEGGGGVPAPVSESWTGTQLLSW